MSAGALEEVGALLAPYRVLTNIYRLESMLADVEGLVIATHVFPDESHTSVVGMNFIRGVQWVYGKPAVGYLEAYLRELGVYEAAMKAKVKDTEEQPTQSRDDVGGGQ